MLELKNVRKSYRSKAGAVNALNGVSLTFNTTGMVFIIGKSGCGKTTLLNVIGGLDGIDDGEIYFQDKAFSTFSANEYDSYRNTLVGFVFQEYNLLEEYTVEYNIKIAMELQGVPVDDFAFEKLLKDLEIEELRSRKPSELSGGQRQRVAIARAFVKQPHIIMADEPTAALDSVTGTQVLDTLKKLSKEKLVIVVSHDIDFAEKYADRIISMVDGKVVEDITFEEKELSLNVSEQENAVIVREGSDLSFEEKDLLAKAVKERKKIELTDHLSFKEKRLTGNVVAEKLEAIAFKKSKMKLKSSAYLGFKSLVVKPIRLVLTILISAIAFAVFGLFDTIANFSTQTSLMKSLENASTTLVATTDYVLDYNASDKFNIKVSNDTITDLSKETNGVVKGIFDFTLNGTGSVSYTHPIKELSSSNIVKGKRYYTNSVNGFIEFDSALEINKEGDFKDFDYTLIAGEYPALRYSNNELQEDSLYEVAISTYLADSILYSLNGKPMGDKLLTDRESLLGQSITIREYKYKIIGLIDCGEIPDKYNPIKTSTSFNAQLNALIEDFEAFINSGAQRCVFVAKGFKNIIDTKNASVPIYYTGYSNRQITFSQLNVKKQVDSCVYNTADFDSKNIVLFNNMNLDEGKISLGANEVLIHTLNLENFLGDQLSALSSDKQRQVRALLWDLNYADKETAIATFNQILNMLGLTALEDIVAKIDFRSMKTGNTISQDVKIVGFYFGIDIMNTPSSSQFKLMINENLMDTLSIYNQQGDYSQLLFSQASLKNGAESIVEYLTSEKGLTLVWHKNSVLKVIRENEPIIQQAADLFLYIALALALFSIFMLYNYISTSIANKRQSIGVLRALGAGGKDIAITFLCESLFIGLINGLLANILCVVGSAFVNSYIMNIMNLSIQFVVFGIRQVFVISAVGLLTVIISSLLPIIRISKRKPVELIRRMN